MQSIIIIGGTSEERLEKANNLSHETYHISPFDTIYISGETSIGIEQIRELEHSLNLKPYNSAYKAAVIHPGELLTVEAQNALLKTLEETGETSFIMLTAPQTETLLPTVVSRCQIIKLPSKLEIEIDEKFLTAHSSLFSNILKAGVGERLKIASQVGKDREEIKDWLKNMTYFCRNILIKNGPLNSLKKSQIIKTVKDLEKTRGLVEQNVNARLALEIFLLDLPFLP